MLVGQHLRSKARGAEGLRGGDSFDEKGVI